MYKIFLLFFIFIFINSELYAQDWNEMYYLEGEAQYLTEEKEYEKAADIYRRMLKEVPDYSYAKYRIGILYLLTDDQKSNAIEYLEEASQDIALDFDEKSLRETRTPVDVLLYLGEAYQIAYRIDEAVVVYNNFKNLIKANDELYPVVVQYLKACENAKIAINNPLRVSKKNLGELINDDNPNFGAVVSGDGNTLIYTSYTRNYIDNYYSVKENGVWSTPKRISEKLSNKYYLKTSSLSYYGKELFLVTDDPEKNDIFVCYKEGKNWIEAEKLPKAINVKKSNETHAVISNDKKSLYFTSDRPGGYGGFDIYKSTLDAKGSWDEAENMGPAINTEFDEETPFITMDDKYLFFSSQGHSSIGGFDIFYIDLESKSMAINLGYPANTTGNDLFFVPDNSLTSGYISQYDNTSVGKRDIYYVSILPKINFAGNIKNKTSGEKITDSGFDISIIETKTNNIVESINTNNGQFEFEINPGNYTLVINNEDYDPFTSEFNIPDNYSESIYSFEALLNPLVIEQEELVAEIIEQPKDKPVVEKEEPEPFVEEKMPEKEIVKYVPKTPVSSGVKSYLVQLMALKNPVKVDYFKNVDNVVLTQYPDGFYRYTVGNTSSYTEAQELKSKIHEIGYKDAFIRVNEVSYKYTIQIMALIIPVKPDYLKDLLSVTVTKGSDDYFRYTIGSFNSYEEAKQELTNLKSIGYNQAFIKKTN